VTGSREPVVARSAQAAGTAAEPAGHLTLFVSGASQLSARAIANVRQLCDVDLAGRYHLTVIDIHERPDAALANNVLAAPTLIKHQPLPIRRVVGDLSHPAKVLHALDLAVTSDARSAHS
jgi:circadian clock protein KaiB